MRPYSGSENEDDEYVFSETETEEAQPRNAVDADRDFYADSHGGRDFPKAFQNASCITGDDEAGEDFSPSQNYGSGYVRGAGKSKEKPGRLF